jgi:TetR/AcrR family transcriptional regulator, cholesterol catabolism regulator
MTMEETDASVVSPTTRSAERATGVVGRRAKRRREIVDAAAQVFYERGYDASSTQDIADVAGILKGSLYYYVKSKEDFLFEIVQDMHEGAIQIIMPVTVVSGDALTKLALIVLRQVEYFAANHIFATVFFREYRALSAERREPIESKGDLYRQIISGLLQEGIEEGTVMDTINVRMAAISIVEMLNSIHRWFRPEGNQSADQVARYLAQVLVIGVASAAAVEARGGLDQFRDEIANMSSSTDPLASTNGSR